MSRTACVGAVLRVGRGGVPDVRIRHLQEVDVERGVSALHSELVQRAGHARGHGRVRAMRRVSGLAIRDHAA